jgi:putative transposase
VNLDLSRGSIVGANGRRFTITDSAKAFDHVEARDVETGRLERLNITDISEPAEEADTLAAPALPTIETEEAEEARRRAHVIRRLLDLPRRRRADIQSAMDELQVGKTTVYRWMRQFAFGGRRLTSLLPTKRPGGRGKSRLNPEVERILQAAIEEHHLRPLQVSVRSTVREIRRRCRNAGVEPPHENTVRSRIAAIPEKTLLRRRGRSKDVYDRLTARPDHFEGATHPLAVVQVDHTLLDVVLVDERYRLPLKRPILTLAFDVFSRMILGFYLSFDGPEALATGLCLARAILPKEEWLARLGVDHEWPCWGLPVKIHVDNGADFRGEMLRLACEQHGIVIDFRPVADPTKGGHIERVLGAVTMQAIHELSGVARKPSERGTYDPEDSAVMTLQELEERLVAYITGIYHQQFHSGINTTPLNKWADAILGDGERPGLGLFPRPTDVERLRIDFMPVVKRTIQPYGVQIDDVLYYSDVLRPHIRPIKRERKQHIFHRDPRDISVIYFWDPDQQQYSAIPYRNSTHPPISVWELRVVRNHLEKEGRANVDERVIFETYERLRKHEEKALSLTKLVRRKDERKALLSREAKSREQVANGQPTISAEVPVSVAPKRFERIEPLEMEEEL